MKDFIIIQEKYCPKTGRFKTYVFNKSVDTFSSEDQAAMKDFECKGMQPEYRHIKINTKTGEVVIMRPLSTTFENVMFFTHDDDKEENTLVIDSND